MNAFDTGYELTMIWIANGSDDKRDPFPDSSLSAEEAADWWLGKQAAIEFANNAASAEDKEVWWEKWAMVVFTLCLSLAPIKLITSDSIWMQILSIPMFLVLYHVMRNVIRQFK